MAGGRQDDHAIDFTPGRPGPSVARLGLERHAPGRSAGGVFVVEWAASIALLLFLQLDSMQI